MSALSGLLNARCNISRFGATSTDAHGRPTGTWSDLASDVKCRIQEMALFANWQYERNQPQGAAVEATHKLWFDAGQDIDEQDRVTIVRVERDAADYDGLVLDVQYVAKAPGGRYHHREVWAKVVR